MLQLETLLGTVEVMRAGHGARGHETLFPVDAALNLPAERYSLGIRRRAAEEATKGAFDEAVRVLTTQSGAHVAKRQVEEVVRRAAVDFTDFYFERRLAWPAETSGSSEVLVLTFDGKGVPMRVGDLRPATQAAAMQREPKLARRLTKGEKRHPKRSPRSPSTRSRRSCAGPTTSSTSCIRRLPRRPCVPGPRGNASGRAW